MHALLPLHVGVLPLPQEVSLGSLPDGRPFPVPLGVNVRLIL